MLFLWAVCQNLSAIIANKGKHHLNKKRYNIAMKKRITLLAFLTMIALSGCTQIVTAPISLAGAAASATLDVAGSAAGAVVKTVSGGD